MCSVVGILSNHPVNQEIYDALMVLQHRGQDAAGILTSNGTRIFLRKKKGLVRDVFQEKHMRNLHGNSGIGHTRYPTAGTDSQRESQPFYVNAPFGLALSHNGNITNADELSTLLRKQCYRHLNTKSDSEILVNILADALTTQQSGNKFPLDADTIFAAVGEVIGKCKGAYSVVALIVGVGIFAFRDRYGIRPLQFGYRNESDGSTSHLFASESVAMDRLNFTFQGDVGAGECIFVNLQGDVQRKQLVDGELNPCIFEYVYMARPDTRINGIEVYKTRIRMGEKLGRRLRDQSIHQEVDVIIPVPDSSRVAALAMAGILKRPYREGIIKNRYIGRTFIMPEQSERKRFVKQKLNAIASEFKDRRVLLVDDSIVRGTTSKEIVQLARDAGAKKVYFASAAPPIRHQNVYGIDMPATSELVAYNRSVSDVCRYIGADKLIYQTLDDLKSAVGKQRPDIQRFDCSCFDGAYVTGDITPDYLKKLSSKRNNQKRKKVAQKAVNHP